MAKQKFSPLSTGFTLVSMLGFIFSVLFVYPRYPPWGVTFAIIFLCMFFASMRSMRYANPDDQLKM